MKTQIATSYLFIKITVQRTRPVGSA
jgi:hypothetical protein